MKKTYKKFLIFFPLVISILAYSFYCGIELWVLRANRLSWRPYITTGMLVITTIGLVIFFVMMGYKLLKGLKEQRKSMKILRLVTVVVIGCITLCISAWGAIFVSLTYTHEKVVKIDETRYVSCLSDWNPSYYHYHEYDGWFTMADEAFKSVPNESIDN